MNLIMYKIAGFALIVITAVGYVYYTDKRIEGLNQKNTELKLEKDIANKKVELFNKEFEKSKLLITKLNVELNETAQDNKILSEKLRKHDLTNLSVKKPKLIENRMNAATIKVFREIEELTSESTDESK